MAKKDPQSPATTSLSYDIMAPRWEKISTLLGGTETMRAAGQKYLPRHPEESSVAFNHRLNCNVLTNMVDMTLNALVSRPFASPIKIGDDVPDEIKAILDDIDLQGTSIDRFARSWFREGIAKGYSAVLVEFPRTPEKADGSKRTVADDQKENLRPYFVFIRSENIISASCEVVNGREILTEVRIFEEVMTKQGFAEFAEEQIRVLTPGKGEVYRKKKDNANKITWVLIETYEYDLDFIPLVMFYSDRQGFMMSKPPLTGLADLNIRHWQSTSDQIAVLTVARFPMLAVSGSAENDDVVIGPNNLLSVTDPTGRFYYVEHTGRAIAVGRQDILDLEEVMAEYGATFLKKRPGGATATARALDSAEVTSSLQDMALGFQDCLNQAMYFAAVWMKKELAGTFGIKTDLSMTQEDAKGLDALAQARLNGDISRPKYLQSLVRYGVLPENFPMAENAAEVEVEKAEKIEQEKDMLKAEAEARPAPVAGPPAK